jgi:hypothetical protein
VIVASVEELQGQLATLKAARASGIQKVRYRDRETWFKTNAEMAAAIRSLESEIAAATDAPGPRVIYVQNSRGW